MKTKFDLKNFLEKYGCTNIIEWGAHIEFMRKGNSYKIYMWQIFYIENSTDLDNLCKTYSTKRVECLVG